MANLRVKIWRRGRGVQEWSFIYVAQHMLGHAVEESTWFTTPGWYHFARKYVYRLTIDHDFPSKPLWLGRRENGEWRNMEGLYEPLFVQHGDFVISARNFSRSRRSLYRISRSAKMIGAEHNRVVLP